VRNISFNFTYILNCPGYVVSSTTSYLKNFWIVNLKMRQKVVAALRKSETAGY